MSYLGNINDNTTFNPSIIPLQYLNYIHLLLHISVNGHELKHKNVEKAFNTLYYKIATNVWHKCWQVIQCCLFYKTQNSSKSLLCKYHYISWVTLLY